MAGAAQKPAKTPRRAFLNPSVRRCREQLAPAGYRSCCVEFVILPGGFKCGADSGPVWIASGFLASSLNVPPDSVSFWESVVTSIDTVEFIGGTLQRRQLNQSHLEDLIGDLLSRKFNRIKNL